MLLLTAGVPGAAADWHHPLYLSGGDYWRCRIPIRVINESSQTLQGVPIEVPIGAGPGQAALVGADATSLRLCDASGRELLFDLLGPDGGTLRQGPIPPGGVLVIPADCPPQGVVQLYVYFDNPAAGFLPDYFEARRGLVNGDMEWGDFAAGPDAAPAGWRHDPPDPQHRAEWTDESPRSGKRCLKTIVEPGAEPTWIATRQHNIRIIGGARYVMTAWVRAKDVRGFAGWYIHLGNRDNPMLASPMLTAGEGTFDWKQVRAEFVAPAEADQADLGTVLRGSGTAWFDDVRLECLDGQPWRVEADAVQRLELRRIGGPGNWPTQGPAAACDRRVLVRAWNLDERDRSAWVGIPLDDLRNRLGGRLDPAKIVVLHQGRPQPVRIIEGRILVEATLPGRSAADYWVYYTAEASVHPEGVNPADYAALVRSPANLLKDADFEADDPAAWTRTPDGNGVSLTRDDIAAPGLGPHSAKMTIGPDTPKGWRGRQQAVTVRPGAAYLVAAWGRCQDLRDGDLRVHLHIHRADGSFSADSPMRSTGSGIKDTTDWTLLAGTFTMPADAARMSVHLTTEGKGTLWHDGALVLEILPAATAAWEARPLPPDAPLAVRPVNPLIKVFPDEPVGPATPAVLDLAGNEYEPLQLAIRSGRARHLRIAADPPRGPNGAVLPPPEIHVVGYVPVDYPTSYYRDENPAWYRKIPHTSPGCDGFAGWWSDPLLPRAELDLPAQETHAVWVTFFAPSGAPPGEYRGTVRLMEPGLGSGKAAAEVPYTLRVRGFSLPGTSRCKAIYDVRLGPGSAVWGGNLDDWYRPLASLMARYRLCPDAVRPMPRFRLDGDRVTADFTAFDEAARWYFDEMHFPHSYTPWDLYLFGWGHPPKAAWGEAPYPGGYPYEGADRGRLRPEFKQRYQQALRLFWDHVKEKGWADRFVLYISDEPFFREEPIIRQMQALCEMIHEVDPAIPIYSSTWHHVPEWDGSLDIWGIGHYGVVPVDEMEAIRASGKRLWFTTDGQMCLDTPYCAVERLLPYYGFRYGVEAYEFWGVAWTTYDPYRFGWHAYISQSDKPGNRYWVRYPNGDGFLIYPGKPIGLEEPVPTIRLAQAREGVEDYECLAMLREAIERGKAAGQDVAEAEAALRAALELVTIPNAGGRYSTKVLPDPDAVSRVRRAAADALEGLLGR